MRTVLCTITAAVLLALGGGQPAGIPTPTGARQRPADSGKAAGPATTTTTLPVTEPGGGLTLFPRDRIVAFYGEPGVPALGVLGDATPARLWPRLAATAAAYARPGTTVLPAYELIAYVAQASAGPSGTYTARIPNDTIASCLSVVQAHHGLLILDIQPGRSGFLADAQALAPWLVRPDVALALDPEWELAPGQVPLRQIGQTTGAQINAVSGWLQSLVSAHHLPQKLLVVHQFDSSMVQDKTAVAARSGIALAFNMDGFGTQPEKLGEYRLLANDTRAYLGMKLFYDRDVGLYTPAEVLALEPAPSIIEYE